MKTVTLIVVSLLMTGFYMNLAAPLQADDVVFDDGDPGGHDWLDGANWEGDETPTSSGNGSNTTEDNAIFGLDVSDGTVSPDDADSEPGHINGLTVPLSSDVADLEGLTLEADAVGDYIIGSNSISPGSNTITFSEDAGPAARDAAVLNRNGSRDLIINDNVTLVSTDGGPLKLQTDSGGGIEVKTELDLNSPLITTAGDGSTITLGNGFKELGNPLRFTANGEGTVRLQGTAKHSGTTFIGAGSAGTKLELNSGGNLKNTSLVKINGGGNGAELEVNQDNSIQDGATVELLGSGDLFDVRGNNNIAGLNTRSGTEVHLQSGNTLVIGSTGLNSRIDGQLTGAGDLALSSAGVRKTVTINSNNASGTDNYTGTTRLNPLSVLEVGHDHALGTGDLVFSTGGVLRPVNGDRTVSNSILVFFRGGKINTDFNQLTLTGQMSGSKFVTKTGADRLILDANNSSFTGGFDLQEGDLEVRHEQALGGSSSSVTMDNAGSALILNAGNNPNIDNDISASSAFNLVVKQDVEVSGEIDGTGDITRKGPGIVELSGSAGTFSGTLNLNQSTTELSGAFGDTGSEVAVNGGALLTGSGTIGHNLSVNSNGTLSPGTSPGVMTVDNDLDLNADSTTKIERDASVGRFLNDANAGTGFDQIIVNGSMTADGNATINLVDLSPSTGSTDVFYPDGARFNAFDVSGSVSGAPEIVDDDHLVSWSLASDGDLQAHRTEYDQVPNISLSENQESVADGFDALAASTPAGAPSVPTPGTSSGEQSDQAFLLNMDALGQEIANGTASGSDRATYRQILNASNPQRYSALFRSHRRVRNAVQDIQSAYMANQLSGRNIGLMSMEPGRPENMMTGRADAMPTAHAYPGWEDKWSGFAKGIGVFAEEDTTSERVGFDADATGAVLGLDRELSDRVLAGVSFTYAATDVNMDTGGDADVDTFRVGPYLNITPNERWYINGSLSYGVHEQDTRRRTMTGTAKAEVDADDISASVGTGYDVARSEDLVVQPMAGLRTSYYDQDAFTESGAGTSNLSVDSESNSSLESRIGARFAKTFDHRSVKEYTPSLTVAWRREFREDGEDTRARFTGSNSSFTVEQGRAPQDALELGTGLGVKVTRSLSVFGNYTGTFYEDADIHALGAGLRLSF